MLWGQGVSTGMWQKEGLCSATVPILTVGLTSTSSALLPQILLYQGGPCGDTEIGESFSEPHPR